MKKKLKYSEEQYDMVDEERGKYVTKLYDDLHRLGLNQEQEGQLLDNLQDDLNAMMFNIFLKDYAEAQIKKQEACKLGFIKDLVLGTNFTAMSSIAISSAIVSGGIIPIAAAAMMGVGGIIKFAMAVHQKHKWNKLVKAERELVGTWMQISQASLGDVLDFYQCNDLQPVLYPFSPLQLERVRDKRKDKTELVGPFNEERVKTIIEAREKVTPIVIEAE